MSQHQQEIKERDYKVVTDSFSQCDFCKKWERLGPVDKEDNMRFVPLYGIVHKGKRFWICNDCFDKREEELMKNDYY